MSFGVHVREVTVLRIACDTCCDGGPTEHYTDEHKVETARDEHAVAHNEAWYIDEGCGRLCLAKTHEVGCIERKED